MGSQFLIASDTSVWIDYFKGRSTPSSLRLESTLTEGALVVPVHVLFEVLSGPGLTKSAEEAFLQLPRLDLLAGYWERSGKMRKALLQKGLKARSIDCLIAQNCIDHNVVFLSGDVDYRHFTSFGLKLARES